MMRPDDDDQPPDEYGVAFVEGPDHEPYSCAYTWESVELKGTPTNADDDEPSELTPDEYDNLTRWPAVTVLGCEHMTFTTGATVDRLRFGCGCIPRLANVATSGTYL